MVILEMRQIADMYLVTHPDAMFNYIDMDTSDRLSRGTDIAQIMSVPVHSNSDCLRHTE